MWFTDSDSEFIWRTSTTNSSVTNFTLPNGHSESYGIAAGGGYIWIVEGAGPLARVSPGTGDIVEYGAVEMGGTSITGIAVGPNGDVWSLQPGQIGSLDPATSVVTNFTIPIPTGGAIGVPGSGIVFGPDGNIWYTDANSAVVRMTVTGAITQFATPTMLSGPGPITVGPDGNIWFTENSGKKIGRISP
jgi:virginiamycin B lyase